MAAMPSAAPAGLAFIARESKSDAGLSYARRAGFTAPAPSMLKKKEAEKTEAERQTKINTDLLLAMQNSKGKALSIWIQSTLADDLLALLRELGLKYQIIKQDGRITTIKLKATAAQILRLSQNSAVTSLTLSHH